MRITAWAIALLLVAPALWAFDGDEHRDLSNLALWLALDGRRCPVAPEDKMGSAACKLLRGGREETFGDVTLAVDWFTKREQLASSDALQTLHDRKWQLFLRLWAIHRNEAHFQGYALSDYDAFHAMAIKNAAGDPLGALLTEAMALHFLQDGFAAGHIVTPRAGFKNGVAGSLHDKFTVDGFPVTVALGKAEALLLERVNTLDAYPTTAICFKDRAALPSGEYKFHGDGRLNANEDQKFALLLVCARSIREVLDAAHSALPTQTLRACYTMRSAKNDGSGGPAEHSFRGPIGAILVGPRGNGVPRDVNAPPDLPQCTNGPHLLEYEVDKYSVEVGDKPFYPFRESLYDFPAFRLTALVGASKNGDNRRSVDLGWVFGAQDPSGSVAAQDGDGKPTDARLIAVGMLSAIAANVSFTTGDGYRAIGGHFEYEIPLPYRTAVAMRVGFRRYSADERRFYRFDYGVKGMIGIEVLNFTVALERGRRLRSDGSFAADTFVLTGIEVTLSPHWFKKLGSKSPGSCGAAR